MIDRWLEENLVCPVDCGNVQIVENEAVCAAGHRYPILDGIPVMLPDDPNPTLWNATASVLQARTAISGGTFELKGHYISAARDAQSLTLEQFAERFGGTVQFWEKIERGETAGEGGKPLVIPAESAESIRAFISDAFSLSTTADRLAEVSEGIAPWVQKIIAATSGFLYLPLVGKLTEYPIPELRMPDGSGKRLLDIGCNWGRWTASALRKGYAAVGIDPSLTAILAARNVFRQLGLNPLLVVGDARRLPFRDDSFSVVFSYSVIQHFSKDNARMALAEVGRVLKQPGTSLIQMPNALGVRSLYHQVRRGFKLENDFDVRYWKLSELKQAFDACIGPSTVSVDGYFGLGIQPSDMRFFTPRHRIVVRASELLRKASERIGWMRNFADSVYIKSTR